MEDPKYIEEMEELEKILEPIASDIDRIYFKNYMLGGTNIKTKIETILYIILNEANPCILPWSTFHVTASGECRFVVTWMQK